MKNSSFALAVLLATLLAGCGVHKTGTSRLDAFDSIRVDQMTGNQIDPDILSRSVLCLNARRETRWVTSVTNVSVNTANLVTITPVTNLTISIATNYQHSLMTNLSALPPAPVIVPVGDATATPAVGPAPPSIEVTNLVTVTNVPAQLSTNLTISLANNQSGTIAPNQVTASQQSVRSYNNQLSTVTNNLTYSLMTNRVVTAETNLVLTWSTNTSVVSKTNVVVTPTYFPTNDYFLVSELIPPPDFIPASGESLILLVDGVRYGLASSQSGTSYMGRRGYNSTLYRVPPEILVDIANAKEVRVRFKGVNSTLERTMSSGSKRHFKEFLVKYFTPEPELPGAENKMTAAQP